MHSKMFITLLLFSCFYVQFSLAVQNKPYYNVNRASELFGKFKVLFRKKYASELEEQKKFQNFVINLMEINFLNSINVVAIFDINNYADLSREEFIDMYTGAKLENSYFRSENPPCKIFLDKNITTSGAPASFDWRSRNKVTKVVNQKKCGSCWAFSLIGNIESQYAILTNNLVELSKQELVDCVTSSHGCDGGDVVETARSLINYRGLELENDYPYQAKDQKCQFDPSKVRVRIAGCSVFDLSDEDKVKEVLYNVGPLSIVLDSDTLMTYSGGIIDQCPKTDLNHAVLLVGYGTEDGTDFWVIKNSWGNKWGEKGFFRLKRGINACGVINDNMVSVVIKV